MFQKWYYNHVFLLLFSLPSFTLSYLKLKLVLRYFFSFLLQTAFIFFFFSIMYVLCKCYSIYGIPVIVYYVVYVTWKPAIKILYIYGDYFNSLCLSGAIL